ncbi:SDR family NAD(P)-dependent oxidoreductase [Nocardioides humi]|uniref:SDR family NAD(P)-dependent oxidoreductase n=1 Tax=Nocardioides humi TaxID=449461 RepID=UPI001C644235|nr:SDR family NAD(P)-dependent oxidoreductase [Nocardioides humi]
MSDLRNRVALVTGAARGQGRSHAVRLAEAGANIIALDICADIDTADYGLGTEEDLAETEAQIRDTGRQVVATRADTRDQAALEQAVADGVAELGRLDIVVANAGILTYGKDRPAARFRDAIEVNLIGTWNTLEASVPHIVAGGRGGAVVITGSTNGTSGKASEVSAGARGYTASKHGLVGLMRSYALALGSESIRVSMVSPTGVNTPMVSLGGSRRWRNECRKCRGTCRMCCRFH